jgi:hypothetical protein
MGFEGHGWLLRSPLPAGKLSISQIWDGTLLAVILERGAAHEQAPFPFHSGHWVGGDPA